MHPQVRCLAGGVVVVVVVSTRFNGGELRLVLFGVVYALRYSQILSNINYSRSRYVVVI